MKETFTRHFFAPIWKCEEIEHDLNQLENDGWRLDRVSGFGKFHFIKSQPKSVKYFFTCSFVKESGMILTEELLKRQFNATQIRGGFIELLKTTSVYRMTKAADLLQRRVYRNIYLRHLVLQYILLGLFFTLISGISITLSCVLNKNPLLDIRHLFFAIVGLFGLIIGLRYLVGLFYLRRQYKKFFQSNQGGGSEE